MNEKYFEIWILSFFLDAVGFFITLLLLLYTLCSLWSVGKPILLQLFHRRYQRHRRLTIAGVMESMKIRDEAKPPVKTTPDIIYRRRWFIVQCSVVDTFQQLIANGNENTKLIHEKKPKVEILDVRLPLMFFHQLSYCKGIPKLCLAIILE